MELDEIRDALSHNRVLPFFQPLQKVTTGELYGAEILARIIDCRKVIVTPKEFIAKIEESELIIPFTLMLLKKVMNILNFMPAECREPFLISFNIPANILADPAILHALRDFSLHAPRKFRLIVEVTERTKVMFCPEETKLIRDLLIDGVALWLDDFGTGYSNFHTLKTGLFTGIKIPREFIQDEGEDHFNASLRQCMAETGKKLNMSVIAEGVETLGQMNSIKNEGIDLVQGYFICTPLCENDFMEYIKATNLLQR